VHQVGNLYIVIINRTLFITERQIVTFVVKNKLFHVFRINSCFKIFRTQNGRNEDFI